MEGRAGPVPAGRGERGKRVVPGASAYTRVGVVLVFLERVAGPEGLERLAGSVATSRFHEDIAR